VNVTPGWPTSSALDHRATVAAVLAAMPGEAYADLAESVTAELARAGYALVPAPVEPSRLNDLPETKLISPFGQPGFLERDEDD
jgi:hypothetical protein